MYDLANLPSLNAIKIGEIFHKPKSGIERLVAKSVRPVTLENEQLTPYIGISGSCTLLRLGGVCFVACTRHQLNIEANQIPDTKMINQLRFVSYVKDENLTNIPVDDVLFVTDNSEEEFHDVLLFHVENQWAGLHRERHCFFPVEEFSNRQRHASWIVGHPSDKNHITFEPQHFNAMNQMIGCKFDDNYISTAKYLKHFSFGNTESNVDGFSGGAAFSLVGDANLFEIVFDGLIVRAGKGNAYVVGSSFIHKMAKKFLPHSHSIVPGGLLVTS